MDDLEQKNEGLEDGALEGADQGSEDNGTDGAGEEGAGADQGNSDGDAAVDDGSLEGGEVEEVETAMYRITGLVDIFDEQGQITGQFDVGSEQELPVSVGDAAVLDGRAERIDTAVE